MRIARSLPFLPSHNHNSFLSSLTPLETPTTSSLVKAKPTLKALSFLPLAIFASVCENFKKYIFTLILLSLLDPRS